MVTSTQSRDRTALLRKSLFFNGLLGNSVIDYVVRGELAGMGAWTVLETDTGGVSGIPGATYLAFASPTITDDGRVGFVARVDGNGVFDDNVLFGGFVELAGWGANGAMYAVAELLTPTLSGLGPAVLRFDIPGSGLGTVYWYRDANPTVTSNFSSGISVLLQ